MRKQRDFRKVQNNFLFSPTKLLLATNKRLKYAPILAISVSQDVWNRIICEFVNLTKTRRDIAFQKLWGSAKIISFFFP